MSASARPHTALTVLTGGLLAGGLLALAAPPAPAGAAPPPVSVAVAPVTVPGSTSAPARTSPPAAPAYRIEVRNASNSSVKTTVRQELPPGTSPAAISPGGRMDRFGAGNTAGAGGAMEVSWQLTLAAGSAATLRTDLAPVRTNVPLTAPACAFASDGDTPYDCATATWHAPESRSTPTAVPWWRRLAALGPGLAGVLALAGLISAGWWRRHRAHQRPTAEGRTGVAGSRPAARTVGQPRAAAPSSAPQRGRHAWLAVGLAATLLSGTGAAVVWTAADRVTSINTDRQPSSGAWIGRTAAGPVGAVLRDASFEFTVYRLVCPRSAPPGGQRCLATVGLRNIGDRSQLWHGQLQRAYLPDGNWITTDEAATRAANQGRDLFADPVPAGERMLFPLVFTTPGPITPTRIELRGAVFSAGVSVEVPR